MLFRFVNPIPDDPAPMNSAPMPPDSTASCKATSLDISSLRTTPVRRRSKRRGQSWLHMGEQGGSPSQASLSSCSRADCSACESEASEMPEDEPTSLSHVPKPGVRSKICPRVVVCTIDCGFYHRRFENR